VTDGKNNFADSKTNIRNIRDTEFFNIIYQHVHAVNRDDIDDDDEINKHIANK
jgi:hypothetical protein